jgi:hypothetical protein
MWRQKKTGVVAVALGVVLIVAGIVDHLFAASKAALCQSDIGQIGQVLDNTVAHDCGLVTAIESAVGWLLVVGVLAAVLGAAVLYNSRTPVQYTSTTPVHPAAPPRPAAPPVPPAPQTAQPVNPPAGPADRPWWTQT